MQSIKEWKEKSLKTITISCRDQDDSLVNLLNHIKKTGNAGHSFSIIVDPDGDNEKFSWDGDGSDYIQNIKVT